MTAQIETAPTEPATEQAPMPAHEIALINALFAANIFAALARNEIPLHRFSYRPRVGTVAYRVLEHFRYVTVGTKLDAEALCQALEIQRTNLVPLLQKVRQVGLLAMHKAKVDGKTKCFWYRPKRVNKAIEQEEVKS